MEAAAESFGMTNLFDLAQILLDIGLIVFMVLLFLRRPKGPQGVEDLTEHLGRVVEETRDIAAQFDTNLQERQKIIQQYLFKLDQRLKEVEQVFQKLDSMKREAQVSPSLTVTNPTLRQSDNQEILRLAQRGLDAAAIAKRLQKPLGEVELILNLQRISPER
jgi:cell shape-determining protein MreC